MNESPSKTIMVFEGLMLTSSTQMLNNNDNLANYMSSK